MYITLTDELLSTQRIYRKVVDELLDSYKPQLNSTQYQVMEIAKTYHKRGQQYLKQSVVVSELDYNKSTISRSLDYLYQQKLVQRLDDPNSKRDKLLRLTELGVKVVDNIHQDLESILADAFSTLDAYAVRQLQINLRAINSKLEEQHQQLNRSVA